MNPDPDMFGSDLRLGHLADADDFGTAGAFINHCAHMGAIGYWLLAIGYDNA
jgi:hypothetical protein